MAGAQTGCKDASHAIQHAQNSHPVTAALIALLLLMVVVVWGNDPGFANACRSGSVSNMAAM